MHTLAYYSLNAADGIQYSPVKLQMMKRRTCLLFKREKQSWEGRVVVVGRCSRLGRRLQ